MHAAAALRGRPDRAADAEPPALHVDLRTRGAGIVTAWLRTLSPASLTAGLALAAVTAVTGFISYTHICALTLVLHQSWQTAHLMPFAVDGQIVVGSVVLLVAQGRTAWWGWLGIAPGLAESLYANWESGIVHGRQSAAWAVVAAQAFAFSSFIFERWLKSQARRVTTAWPATAAEPQAEAVSAPAVDAVPEAPRPLTPDLALQALLDSASPQMLALLLGVSRNKVRAWQDRQEAAGAPEDEPGDPVAERELVDA